MSTSLTREAASREPIQIDRPADRAHVPMFLAAALWSRTLYFSLFRRPLGPAPLWLGRLVFVVSAIYLLWTGVRGT
jgi:hypothetical protein